MTAESGRFLVFELGGNQYAVEVERVEVVLEMMQITRVPKAPPYLKGVINYRGTVIPVGDLQSRFTADAIFAPGSEGKALPGLEAASPAVPMAEDAVPGEALSGAALPAVTEEKALVPALSGKDLALLSSGSSIIVLHLDYAGDDIVMGILADAVREVMDIDAGHMAVAPGLGMQGESRLISGIGEKDGNFIVILDVDEAFSSDMDSAANAGKEKWFGAQEQAREEK